MAADAHPVDEHETMELAKAVSRAASRILQDACRDDLVDLLLVFSIAEAMSIAYSVSRGSDLEACLAVQAKTTRLVAEALIRGDKPRFDA